LSDVAVLEKATDATGDYSVLYVSSLNNGAAAFSFDSVRRSKSDPLGGAWERVLIWNSSDAGTILRVNPRLIPHSKVIVFADLTTANILHSLDEGQLWTEANANIPVSDIGLLDDNTMYVLGDYTVRKITRNGASFLVGRAISTNLVEAGHTISIPLKADIVIIGTTGLSDNYVAWADFNKTIIKFTQLAALPGGGDTHVVADSEFNNNKMIYAAMRNIPGNDGTVFRWTLDKSKQWDVLDPINRAFYGSEMLDNVYYASWNFNTTSTADGAGADRTLYPRVAVPPPPEWNELPVTDNISTKIAVKFTREPTALKESTNTYNTLWAIDDEVYQYSSADNRTGCLWAYVDSISKLGPWPTSPPPGSLIGPDTVTGRNKQIDFKWRPLKDIFGYDLLIAKDADFTLILTQNIANQPVDDRTGAYIIIPGDQEAPGCWLTPGALETGRPYYWRVRGSRTIDGFTVHSPWSATMSFSVQPGFIVQSKQHGPTLLSPEGSCVDCRPPIRFSWAPVEGVRKYQITLAKDPELKDVIMTSSSTTTAFEYKEKLEFSRTYYWQVRVSEPAASDPSPVGSFILTEAKAAPSSPATPAKTDKSEPAVSGFWIWIIIVIVTVVMVLINVLAFISRNRS
jgi:hypothetical protein